MGDGRQGKGDERWDIGDRRRETEDGRQKIGDRRRETEDMRPETGDRRWETVERRWETGERTQEKGNRRGFYDIYPTNLTLIIKGPNQGWEFAHSLIAHSLISLKSNERL